MQLSADREQLRRCAETVVDIVIDLIEQDPVQIAAKAALGADHDDDVGLLIVDQVQ